MFGIPIKLCRFYINFIYTFYENLHNPFQRRNVNMYAIFDFNRHFMKTARFLSCNGVRSDENKIKNIINANKVHDKPWKITFVSTIWREILFPKNSSVNWEFFSAYHVQK